MSATVAVIGPVWSIVASIGITPVYGDVSHADTLHHACDVAIQLNGARGFSKDTILEWIYRYARQAKLVDGASEVHKMVLSRSYLGEGDRFWSWS